MANQKVPASRAGHVVCVKVAPGRYDVAVVTNDKPIQRIARVRGVEVASRSTLDLVVLPPYVTLSGVVRDLSGAPLHGGRVGFGDQYSPGTWSNMDSDGH